MDWAEPKHVREWAIRSFSLRPILTILILFGILISELRFDWMEQMLGAFLVRTNAARPESGAIWEMNRQSQTAQRILEQIITDRQSLQREARSAESFVELSSSLAPDQGVMLSPDDFRKLYLGLPTAVAHEIISPIEILKLFSENRFVRAYIEKQENGLQLYFLEAENRVLRRFDVQTELLELIARSEQIINGALEDFPKFRNRVYPSEQFLGALAALPEDSRRHVLYQPERLLMVPGRIVRVGIADESISGNIEIGFEFQAGTLTRVVFLPGREWAVWQIRTMLEGKKVDNSPASAPMQ